MPIDIDMDCMRQKKNNIIVSKGWYLKNVLGDQSLGYIAWGGGGVKNSWLKVLNPGVPGYV